MEAFYSNNINSSGIRIRIFLLSYAFLPSCLEFTLKYLSGVIFMIVDFDLYFRGCQYSDQEYII